MKKILLLISAALIASGAAAQKTTWGMKAGVNGAYLTNGKKFFTEHPNIADKIDTYIANNNLDCAPTPNPADPSFYEYPCGNVTDGVLLRKEVKVPPKVSLYAGFYMEHKFSDKMSLQVELMYSRQGGQTKQSAYNRQRDRDDYTIKAWVQTDYINIPILFKYYFSKRFSLDIGPQVGILLHNELKMETVMQNNMKSNTTASLPAQSVDIAVALGATYNFAYIWNVSLRNNFSLTPVLKKSGATPECSNNVIQLGLGRRF